MVGLHPIPVRLSDGSFPREHRAGWRICMAGVVQHWVRIWELGVGDNGGLVIPASGVGKGARPGNDSEG